ncbi:MAG: N-acetyl sugar amidotransferase [Cyanobacteria bacterium HKST-UBA02]|nr:N-acetyl sugar amidotransferase [Cyanobacteria bacterium HKST-UBA02]
MRYCNKCVMPDTKPDLFFDEHGVCDACRSAERKHTSIDWEERTKAFEELVKTYRGKGEFYDCLIPVSGGKDSTYQVHVALEHGLKPLCVSFEPTFATELGKRNLANISAMGVDLIQFRKNPRVYKQMCQIGFSRLGDHDWPNHVGIFTVPIRTAVQYKVPLIIWGENPQQEYGGPLKAAESSILDRRWLEEFGGLLGYRVSDMVAEGIAERDLVAYVYPTEAELKAANLCSIFLGHYFKWDAVTQVEIVKGLGFELKEDGPVEGTYTNYENLDCAFTAIHDYLKYVKFGFGRATDHACLDVRNGRITRDEAVNLVNKFDGRYPRIALSDFLEYMDLSQEEFDRIVDSFTNKHVFVTEDKKFARDSEGNLIKRDPLTKLTSGSFVASGSATTGS